MTHERSEPNLDELRRQFRALRQVAQLEPENLGSRLPEALTACERALDQLRDGATSSTDAPPARTTPPPHDNGFESSNGHAPTDVAGRAEHAVDHYRSRVRSLMAELLLAEENERRLLAVDLHDGLSQTIALAQIKLSALRAALGGKLTDAVREIEELIEQANRAARSISFELSPLVLHDLGLEPALQWLVENIHSRYGIQINLEDDGQPKPTDARTRVILFRAVRELLINAAKHSKAKSVRVRMTREADRLSVSVEDDGIGMDSETARVNGFGLFSIHERVSHVGGTMSIDSELGRGTRVRLGAPLERATPAKFGASK